jgi:hypothetical protein
MGERYTTQFVDGLITLDIIDQILDIDLQASIMASVAWHTFRPKTALLGVLCPR